MNKKLTEILTILISVLLILNIIFQGLANNCNNDLHYKESNLTNEYIQLSIKQSGFFYFLKNYSLTSINQSSESFGLTIERDNLTSLYSSIVKKSVNNVNNLTFDIGKERITCQRKRLIADALSYFALFLSLLLLFKLTFKKN